MKGQRQLRRGDVVCLSPAAGKNFRAMYGDKHAVVASVHRETEGDHTYVEVGVNFKGDVTRVDVWAHPRELQLTSFVRTETIEPKKDLL
jgi:hypothetical protein